MDLPARFGRHLIQISLTLARDSYILAVERRIIVCTDAGIRHMIKLVR